MSFNERLLHLDNYASRGRESTLTRDRMMETSATCDRLRQVCQQIYQSWITLVEQTLMDAGFDATQAKSWTMLIWSALEGALLLSRTYRSTEPLEMVASQLKTLLNQSSKA